MSSFTGRWPRLPCLFLLTCLWLCQYSTGVRWMLAQWQCVSMLLRSDEDLQRCDLGGSECAMLASWVLSVASMAHSHGPTYMTRCGRLASRLNAQTLWIIHKEMQCAIPSCDSVFVVVVIRPRIRHSLHSHQRGTHPRAVPSITHVPVWTHANSVQSSLALSCSNCGVYASSSRTTLSVSHNHSLSVTPTITTPLACLSPPSVVRAQEWSRSGSFMQKPKQGWLHDDDSLSQGDGVYYPVKVHITCIRVVVRCSESAQTY